MPPSIREAALGVGASQQQTVSHHVLPLAMPGILTGTIIGMAHALGETAPLLMIGMVAFIVDVPTGFTDAATVLPVQIFLWSDSPERAFVEQTAAAIIVLLAFLVVMNAAAICFAGVRTALVELESSDGQLITEMRWSNSRRSASRARRRNAADQDASRRDVNVFYGEKQAMYERHHRHPRARRCRP